jgi:hypothetical protein
VDIQIRNALVEGEREGFEALLEHVNEDNQLIPQLAKPENDQRPVTSPIEIPTTVEHEPTQPKVVITEDNGGHGRQI